MDKELRQDLCTFFAGMDLSAMIILFIIGVI